MAVMSLQASTQSSRQRNCLRSPYMDGSSG